MSEQTTIEVTPQAFNDHNTGNAHEYLGFEVTDISPGHVVATMQVRADHLNPMGGLHGGVTASFADSLCGYGVVATLQQGTSGFATLTLNANYLGRAAAGDVLVGTARLLEGSSRRLQTWDVTVATGERTVAVVRVTQLILRPDRSGRG